MSLQNRLFKPTPSPLEVEQQKLQQGKFEAPDNMVNQISKDHLTDVIKGLAGQYQGETDEGRKKVIEARLKSIGVYFMQKEIEATNKDSNQRLIKEFDDFLLGKSKYNTDPKYAKMVFWGKRKLVGESIDDYLKTILEKKIEFDTRMGMMRRGGYIPSDIEEAWYYYLFVLCNKNSPTDMFFKPWEAYYPAPLNPPHQKDLRKGATYDQIKDPETGNDLKPDNIPPSEQRDKFEYVTQDDEARPRLMGARSQPQNMRPKPYDSDRIGTYNPSHYDENELKLAAPPAIDEEDKGALAVGEKIDQVMRSLSMSLKEIFMDAQKIKYEKGEATPPPSSPSGLQRSPTVGYTPPGKQSFKDVLSSESDYTVTSRFFAIDLPPEESKIQEEREEFFLSQLTKARRYAIIEQLKANRSLSLAHLNGLKSDDEEYKNTWTRINKQNAKILFIERYQKKQENIEEIDKQKQTEGGAATPDMPPLVSSPAKQTTTVLSSVETPKEQKSELIEVIPKQLFKHETPEEKKERKAKAKARKQIEQMSPE